MSLLPHLRYAFLLEEMKAALPMAWSTKHLGTEDVWQLHTRFGLSFGLPRGHFVFTNVEVLAEVRKDGGGFCIGAIDPPHDPVEHKEPCEVYLAGAAHRVEQFVHIIDSWDQLARGQRESMPPHVHEIIQARVKAKRAYDQHIFNALGRILPAIAQNIEAEEAP